MSEIIPKEKRWKALAIGTLIGFFGVGLIDFLHALVSFYLSDYENFEYIIVLSLYYIIIGLPLAFLACFIVGIPLYLIIDKVSIMNRKAALTLGVFMGLIFGLVNFVFFFLAWPLWVSVLDLLSTIIVGGLAGSLSFNITKQPMINYEKFE